VVRDFVLFNFSFVLVDFDSLFIGTFVDTFVIFWVFLFIYFFGLFGVLVNLKNILISLLMVELTYLGVISYFMLVAVIFDLNFGFIFALLLILVAAAESVIGLGLVIVVFRFQKKVTYNSLISLNV
jgi:NADH-quinone oxidoreductase subunit K